MIYLIELIACCVLSALVTIIATRRNRVIGVQTMHPKLQKRVVRMRQYRSRNIKILPTKERFVKKIPLLILITIALTVMIYITGARSFARGFLLSFILWAVLELFKVFVIQCGWYAHCKSVWIEDTEDLEKKVYKNYRFYMSFIPRSLAIGLFVSILVGVIVDGIPTLDENNYADTYTEIDDTMKQAVEDYKIPGLSVMVVDSEGIVFSGAYGECTSTFEPFVIGSLSKSFTATAIMKLSETGRLNLDDKIAKYIDADKCFSNPSDADEITVRQLLNQTSGLGVYQNIGSAKIVKKGGEYSYSDVNYDLLGEIVENVSKCEYGQFVRQQIFVPLGMTQSAASYEEAMNNGVINGYKNYYGFYIESELAYPDENEWGQPSSEYITSSAYDMGKYLQMYLRGGSGVVTDKSINAMLYDNVYMDESGYNKYGMGWVYSDEYVETVFNHTGYVENYMASMYLLPESDLGVVFLANTSDYLVGNNLMDVVTKKAVLTLLGYATDELDEYAYWDMHIMYDLLFVVVLAVAINELIKSRHWHIKSEGNITVNIFLHVFIPTGMWLGPIIMGIPLWTIWKFATDVFIVIVLSAFLLYLGGLVKLLKRRNAVY